MNDSAAPAVPELPKSKISRLALTSLALGIFSPFLCFIVSGIPAVICGHVALRKIKRSGGTQTGSGLAVTGLTLGYLSFFTSLVVGLLLAELAPTAIHGAEQHMKIDASIRNARVIVQACRAYADAHNGQFPDTLDALMELQLLEEKVLTSPLAVEKNGRHYVYIPGYDMNSGGRRVLVYDRHIVKRGGYDYYILGFADGSASADREVDITALLQRVDQALEAEETPVK